LLQPLRYKLERAIQREKKEYERGKEGKIFKARLPGGGGEGAGAK